jgi:hypothetical protein
MSKMVMLTYCFDGKPSDLFFESFIRITHVHNPDDLPIPKHDYNQPFPCQLKGIIQEFEGVQGLGLSCDKKALENQYNAQPDFTKNWTIVFTRPE